MSRAVGSSSITRTVAAFTLATSIARRSVVVVISSSVATTTDGSHTENVVPLPDSLSTVTCPPIISAKCLVMASPSPVPPYFFVVEASACMNGWKSRVICSSVMPMPVSDTRKLTPAAPFPSTTAELSRATESVIVPWSVNLLALESRLNRICRTFTWSARMKPMPAGISTCNAFPFLSSRGCTVARHPAPSARCRTSRCTAPSGRIRSSSGRGCR